jgi:hypothetical protein
MLHRNSGQVSARSIRNGHFTTGSELVSLQSIYAAFPFVSVIDSPVPVVWYAVSTHQNTPIAISDIQPRGVLIHRTPPPQCLYVM